MTASACLPPRSSLTVPNCFTEQVLTFRDCSACLFVAHYPRIPRMTH